MATYSENRRRGWLMVAYGALSLMILQYLCYNAFSLFVVPITEDLGISRSALSLTTTIASIAGMVIAPIAGRLFSVKSVRKLMLMGLTVTSLSIALQYFAKSVMLLYVLAGVRDCGVEFCLMMPLAILMNRWFGNDRSFAFSIISIGTSLGGVLLSVPLSNLIAGAGWRNAYLICGLGAMAILVPLCFFIVKDWPEGTQPASAPKAGEDGESAPKGDVKSFTAQLHKDGRFWLLAIGLMANSFCCVGLYHISTFAQSLAFDPGFAAMMISVHSIGAVVSKLLMGKLFDRKGIRGGVLLGSGCQILAYGLMILACMMPGKALLVASILAYGLSFGSQSLYSSSIISRIFDMEYYSIVAGELAVFVLLAGAFSNPVVSAVYDMTHSYSIAWTLCLAMGAVALVCLMSLGKKKA